MCAIDSASVKQNSVCRHVALWLYCLTQRDISACGLVTHTRTHTWAAHAVPYLNTAVHLLALQWGVCVSVCDVKIVDLWVHTHTVKWDWHTVCRRCTAVLWYILWLRSQWASGYWLASEVTPPLPRHGEQSARLAGQGEPLNPRSPGRWLVKVSA